MKKNTFEELNLSANIQKAIKEMGFSQPTPIQAAAVPALMSNMDIIAQAHTGSGKTAAFAIPIIENIDVSSKNLQALIVCPTRELAVQVSEEFRKIFKYYRGLSVVTLYGGQDMNLQLRILSNKPQIVVGTPGRLMDHMWRGTIKLDAVRFAVLDEADKMLDMGFRKDIETIFSYIPEKRQTAMFSATMTPDIMTLMRTYQNNPLHIDTTDHKLEVPKIDQSYCALHESQKHEMLRNLIDNYDIKVALVFANTKSRVDRIVRKLNDDGYRAEGIHGGYEQNRRERIMDSFRRGSVKILVATDVMGRGLDINNIDAVINYDFPRDIEDYTHRVGRTGRAGKAGCAFTFVVGEEIDELMRIKKNDNLVIKCIDVPGGIKCPLQSTMPARDTAARGQKFHRVRPASGNANEKRSGYQASRGNEIGRASCRERVSNCV